MGRKSVPSFEDAALPRMRLRDALEDEACRVAFADDAPDDEIDVMPAPACLPASLPGHLTLEDLYRRNRNRARLIGLLHSQRSSQGASIIVLMTDGDEAPHHRDALGWIVRPHDGETLGPALPRLVH